MRLWVGGLLIASYEGHTAAVWSLLPQADGKIISGSADNSLRIWETPDDCKEVIRVMVRVRVRV